MHVVNEHRAHQRPGRLRGEYLDAEVARSRVGRGEHAVLRHRARPGRGCDVEGELPPRRACAHPSPALHPLGERVVGSLLGDECVRERSLAAVGGPVETPAREHLQRRLHHRARTAAAVGRASAIDVRRGDEVGVGRSGEIGERGGGLARGGALGECVEGGGEEHVGAPVGVAVHPEQRCALPEVGRDPARASASSATTSSPAVPSAATGIRSVPLPLRAVAAMRSQIAARGRSIASTSAPQAQSGPSGPISEPAPTSTTVRPGSESHSG